MQEIELEQGTDKWLEERKRYIGGSDVPAIMGVSKWKTEHDLWLEKTGQEVSEPANDFVLQKGHRMEIKARRIYEAITGIDIPPKVVQRADLDYCRVSLDGLNKDRKHIVEIKYVGRSEYLKLKKTNEVPEHYMPQVQYQMFCTGIYPLVFIAITDEKIKRETTSNPMFSGIHFFKVEPDIEMMKKIKFKCDMFWKYVQTNTPPPLDDRDFIEVKDDGLINAIEDYRDVKREYDKIKKQLDEKAEALFDAKNLVLSLTNNQRMIYQNIKLTKYSTKGRVNYKKIPELANVDLEQYRGPSTESFKISGV